MAGITSTFIHRTLQMHSNTAFAAALLAAAASIVGAQPQQRPAIRPLGPVVATSRETFGTIASVRPLSDGRVLVNDVSGRRVVMLDATLSPTMTVADSTSATGTAYAGRFGGLLAYRGDSTLFVDPQSLSMLVIDPAGKIARVMSVPRSQEASALAGGGLGASAFDGRGLVYRAPNRFRMMGGPGAGAPSEQPDTVAIVRVNLATRALDTVAFVKVPKNNMQMTQDDQGRMNIRTEVNPLPTVDDWTVLPDGSIAIVRGRDYRIDWVNPDGTRSSSPKLPFEWQRLSDEDKVAFIDSVKAARERLLASQPAPSAGGGPVAGGMPGGATVVTQMRMTGPDGAVTSTSGGAAQVEFVPASELPDHKPPFFAGAVRADREGNVWIRTTATGTAQGATVYDVVNRGGQLIDRVQVPAGRTIAAFGADGAVYLTSRDGAKTVLERATVR